MNRLLPPLLAAMLATTVLVAAAAALGLAAGPFAATVAPAVLAPQHGGTSLAVPDGPPPTIDGRCTEYGNEDAQVRLQDPTGSTVFLRATAAALYLCFRDLPLTDNGTRELPFAAVNLDPDHSGGALAGASDFRLRIELDSRDSAFEVGDGDGGWLAAQRSGWAAASARHICGRALCADAEFQVPAELIDNWADTWGLFIAHHRVTAPGDDRVWPWQAPGGLPAVPDTWADLSRTGMASATPNATASGTAAASPTPTASEGPPPSATAPLTATLTLTPTTAVSPEPPATPEASVTAEPTATGAGTATPLGPEETPGPEPTASPIGTGLPPAPAGLMVEPALAHAGGTVRARGAHYACPVPGIILTWPDGTRLAWTADDPFDLALTLPVAAPPGAYTISARCATAAQSAARAGLRLEPAPPPPVADFDLPPGPLHVGQVLALADASTYGVVRRDWDFGDGSPPDHRSQTGHVYGLPGTYTVTLTVFDGAGRQDLQKRVVVVEEAVARGRLEVGPDGRTVAFLDHSQGPFTAWHWDFGDGNGAARRAVSHRYTAAGTYMPRLVASYPGPGGRAVARAVELGPLVIGDAGAHNLALVGLDLVQVNLADRVLAARRPTLARLRVRREGPDEMATARYDLRLRAYRADGTQVAGVPFLRRLSTARGESGNREDLVELELPQEWLLARTSTVEDPRLGQVTVSEPITLSAEVRALNLVEPNLADNRLARPATFEPGAGLDLLLVSPVVRPADLARLYSALLRTVPVAGSDLRAWLPLGGPGLDLPPAQSAGPEAARVAAEQAFRSTGQAPAGLRGLYLAPGRTVAEREACATARSLGGQGLWVAAAGPADITWPGADPLTALVRALALQDGLAKAPGGRPGEGPIDPTYPVADGRLDGDGYDLATLSLRPRAEHHDYLSAAACPGGQPWWSAHNYGRWLRRRAPRGSLAGWGAARAAMPQTGEVIFQPPPLASDYAVLSGIIRPPEMGGERLLIEPIFHYDHRRDPSDDALGAGDWSITLLDNGGRTLFTRFLAVTYPLDEAGRPRPRAFFQVLPWHAFTRRVEIREGETLVWERTVPASWPLVEVTGPVADETWEQGRTYFVRWNAEDPEGLDLAYQVDLSADNGATWRPVGSIYRQTSVPLQTAYLPGCDACRLRVRASNGILMSEAESGPFRIAPPPPVAQIVAPVDGARVVASEPLWLEGLAYDHTDGPLGPGRVAWTSDLDGHLGWDTNLQTQLSVGRHVIQFAALNSHGQRGVAAVTVQVLSGRRDHRVFVPWAGQP